MTNHPTNTGEYYEIYARSVFDELKNVKRGLILDPVKFALKVHHAATERTLREIGYYKPSDNPHVWYYLQASFRGSVPVSWVSLPVENMAEKIAEHGINMLNDACRRPDVQVV
jgi:hypothetical protein